VVNLYSDSHGKSNTTVTLYDVSVDCLRRFRSFFAHFNYSLLRCCLFAAVVALDFFLKSVIIVSTHRRRHVASGTGFKPDLPNPNSDSDSLTEYTSY